MKGWHRKATVPASEFIRALASEQRTYRDLAQAAGVSVSVIHDWASGRCQADPAKLQRLVDGLLPMSAGSLPVYSPEMAIDGGTRVGGVSEYTIYQARGGQWTDEDS
jgi:hypothetical protein